MTKKVVPKTEHVAVPPQTMTPAPVAEPADTPPTGTADASQPSVYHPTSERDPFKSFITAKSATPVRAEAAPKFKTPLQRYSLDQLKVVGIISGGTMRKALLEDDVGKGYVVSVGDPVGSEGGEIVAIHKDSIVVQTKYRDVLGNQKVRDITKKLFVSEEGENP